MTPEEIATAATRVEAQLGLSNIRLERSNSEVGLPLKAGQLTVQMGIEVTPEQTAESIAMRVAYTVVANRLSRGGKEDLCWKVEVTYVVDYKTPAEVSFSREELDMLGAVSSTLTVHPYARAFVHMMTTQMGYPSFGLQPLTAHELAELSTSETPADV
ncbi:hypothetical protein [Streptosporangium sp. NPDC004631]